MNENTKWITSNDNPRIYGRIRAVCPYCGSFAPYEMVNVGSFKEQLSNYCPNCGKSMKCIDDKIALYYPNCQLCINRKECVVANRLI